MTKRTVKQDLILWAKRQDADDQFFMRHAPTQRARNYYNKSVEGFQHPFLSGMNKAERVILLLLVAAGMRV